MLLRANCLGIADDNSLFVGNRSENIWNKAIERPVSTADDISCPSCSDRRLKNLQKKKTSGKPP